MWDARPVRPRDHLLDSRGAVRVRGDDQRLAALIAQAKGKLAGRGRLPRSVYPVHQHARRRALELQLARLLRHGRNRHGHEIVDGFLARSRRHRADARGQPPRHRGTDVRREEHLLELVVVTVRERRAEGAQPRGKRAASPAADPAPEACFGLAQPACALVAARVAGLRMSSSRTETRCDEPLSSRWMPYSVDAYDIVT